MAVRDVVQAAAGVGGGSEYVEDVFSTYLYTGNSSTQTITNGIDLAGEGGLVWTKARGVNAESALIDTERGQGNYIPSNATSASAYYSDLVTGFTSTGYTLGADVSRYIVNKNAYTYASWTFRKAPKFFDVVTYTGTGVARTIAHSLESTPACIFIKRTDVAGEWRIWNSNLSTPNTQLLYLNRTDAVASTSVWSTTSPTDTEFSLNNASSNNASGGTFVAYLFASNAGGFGDDGEQNVISCGSVAGQQTINLGWEPQWLLMKRTDSAGDWRVVDAMRGLTAVNSNDAWLAPNTSAAESVGDFLTLNSTGFFSDLNGTYIYIAIRRPMKTPESGTEVFAPIAYTTTDGSWQDRILESNFTTDLAINGYRNISDGGTHSFVDRLRGYDWLIRSHQTNAESQRTDDYNPWPQTGQAVTSNEWSKYNGGSGLDYYNYQFRRAPGFFDVVCYAGTDIAHTEAHSLGVAPEMIIVKRRTNSSNWSVLHNSMNTTGGDYIRLDLTTAKDQNVAIWNSTLPTNAVFTVGVSDQVNHTYQGAVYVAYLFASLPGISKVSSYTGTGADLNVDCGFSAGARFILIKRTDSTGDWYVWDSARGIVAGNDPYLRLNSTAAEVTSTDYIDPLASGFTVTSSAPAALNASGGSYIFLAIA